MVATAGRLSWGAKPRRLASFNSHRLGNRSNNKEATRWSSNAIYSYRPAKQVSASADLGSQGQYVGYEGGTQTHRSLPIYSRQNGRPKDRAVIGPFVTSSRIPCSVVSGLCWTKTPPNIVVHQETVVNGKKQHEKEREMELLCCTIFAGMRLRPWSTGHHLGGEAYWRLAPVFSLAWIHHPLYRRPGAYQWAVKRLPLVPLHRKPFAHRAHLLGRA